MKHLWAVGQFGKVLYSNDGISWAQETLPDAVGRNEVWGVVVGNDITVFSSGGADVANSELAVRSPAGVWSWLGTGRGKPLFGIWCDATDNIDATEMDFPGTGRVKSILHYNGVAWSELASIAGVDFFRIHAGLTAGSDSAPTGVVYLNGVKLGNSRNWSRFRGAYNAGGGSYFAAGSDPLNGWLIVSKFVSPNWVDVLQVPSSNRFEAIHGVGLDIWAVGQNGTIYHSSNGGGSWSPQVSGTSEDLNGVFALTADEVYAVGSGVPNGTLLCYDGVSWSPRDSSAVVGALNGVWGGVVEYVGPPAGPPIVTPEDPLRDAIDVDPESDVVFTVVDDGTLVEPWYLGIHRGDGWETAMTFDAGSATFHSGFDGQRSSTEPHVDGAGRNGYRVRIHMTGSLRYSGSVFVGVAVVDDAGLPAEIA